MTPFPESKLTIGQRLASRRLRHSVGSLLGLAVGDALGTTNEFCRGDQRTRLTGIVGGGPFALKPGQWTDDTSMALCLAESLLTRRGFDAADQMQRYLRWYREGHLSCTGACFDIGTTTANALQRFEHDGAPYCGTKDPRQAGNGSLMRLAPIPIAWQWDPASAIALAGESSRTTHGAPQCISACRYYCALILGAIEGHEKVELLSPQQFPYRHLVIEGGLDPEVRAVLEGSYLALTEGTVRPSGYVVDSLAAALWCFATTDSFRDGALKAANLGGDADTIAAIYGMLAGAHYGIGEQPELDEDDVPAAFASIGSRFDLPDVDFEQARPTFGRNPAGIPESWLETLCWAQEISASAAALYSPGSFR